jgi:hypothetical protein
VKAAERRQKGVSLGVQARQLDGAFDRIGAVVDEKAAAQIPGVVAASSRASAARHGSSSS